jgi:hypothetical protein
MERTSLRLGNRTSCSRRSSGPVSSTARIWFSARVLALMALRLTKAQHANGLDGTLVRGG